MTTAKKTSNKRVVIGVIVLAAVIALMAIAYNAFREKPVQGSKEITIEVVGKDKNSTVYELATDAEYLRQAMEEAEEQGLTFEIADGMVHTVNGVTADFAKDSAYWSLYVNDEYGQLGVDSQPVEDGDAFRIEYTIYVAQ